MREILDWTGVYRRATKIVAQSLGKKQAAPPHPLTLTWSDDEKIFRVHVQDDADPSGKAGWVRLRGTARVLLRHAPGQGAKGGVRIRIA